MTAPWGDLGKPGHVNRDSEWEALLDCVGAPPMAQLRQTSATSIPTADFTPLTFEVEDYDTHDGHSTSTNTTRYTCRVAGIYQLFGKIAWTSNATGQRVVCYSKNATIINGSQVSYSAVAAERQFPGTLVYVSLAVDDYVEMEGFQDSGGALDTSVANAFLHSIFNVRWVGIA